MDFAMTYSLVQTAKETQSQFFDKKYANDLGVIRYVLELMGRSAAPTTIGCQQTR
jgi:hypothetical protein